MIKAGLADYSRRLKSFVKTYHEIRYNPAGTIYVPNFDKFSLADMVQTIHTLTGKETSRISTWKRREIENEYFRLIRGEAKQLERESVDFVTS